MADATGGELLSSPSSELLGHSGFLMGTPFEMSDDEGLPSPSIAVGDLTKSGGPLLGSPSPSRGKRPARYWDQSEDRNIDQDDDDDEDFDDDDDADIFRMPWKHARVRSRSPPLEGSACDTGKCPERTAPSSCSLTASPSYVQMWHANEPSASEMCNFPTVDELFISEEDLERAKNKLPEHEHLTAEETLERLVSILAQFRIGDPGPLAMQSPIARDVTLCYNHVPVAGQGIVGGDRDEIVFSGQSILAQKAIVYSFPINQLIDVRRKFPEDEIPFLSVTIERGPHFLQFATQEASSVDSMSAFFRQRPAAEVARDSLLPEDMGLEAGVVAAATAMADELERAALEFQERVAAIKAKYSLILAGVASGTPSTVEPEPAVIEPCGHKICEACWNKLPIPRACPWDRIANISATAL